MHQTTPASHSSRSESSKIRSPRRSSGGVSGDRGSGTVLGLAAIGVLLSVLLAAGMLGGAVLARQQAQNAADLGAVAGAQLLKNGGDADAVCARAGRWVEANGGLLDECSVRRPSSGVWRGNRGPQVTVTVYRDVKAWPRWVARVSAVAGLVPVDRQGPAVDDAIAQRPERGGGGVESRGGSGGGSFAVCFWELLALEEPEELEPVSRSAASAEAFELFSVFEESRRESREEPASC